MLNKYAFQEIIESKKNERILIGNLSAVESYVENGEEINCGIIFYKGIKVYIPYNKLGLINEQELFDNPKEVEPKDIRKRIRDIVGSIVDFIVDDYDEYTQVAYASRDKALEYRRTHDLIRFKTGDVVSCRIVDTGKNHILAEAYGVHAIIPIDEVAWGRIFDIRDYYKKGDIASALITDINYNPDNSVKLKLSLKRTQVDPFKEFILNKKYYQTKGEYKGVIRQSTEYGIFVQLRKGINVLCNYPHWMTPPPKPGKEVCIRIKRIRDDRKIDGNILREL